MLLPTATNRGWIIAINRNHAINQEAVTRPRLFHERGQNGSGRLLRKR